MSKDKIRGGFILICDICGHEEFFKSFEEMLAFKKTEGWQSKKEFGEWFDYCTDCKSD